MHTATANRYAGTNFVTGMRAFAALGVLFIHTGGLWFREWGEIGNNLADLGKTGVYVFFVISGFSVSQSYETSGSYLDYFTKRLRRIAPLYFLWSASARLPASQALSNRLATWWSGNASNKASAITTQDAVSCPIANRRNSRIGT